jgi:imidazolonepropionase-like amidohydrolase
VNELGVDPMTAIHAATLLPAEIVGVQRDYGSVEPGKSADLIVVHGDPLQHINIVRDPVIIMKRGIQFK